MIWLIGDFHGGKNIDGLKRYLSFCQKDDLLIVLGDVGLYFDGTAENEAFSKWFLSLDCEIAFLDGNHENFDYLNSFPEEDWCGGRVRRLSDHIVYLMRGYIFTIQDKTFLVMGGCKSTDRWKKIGLWWEEEQPNEIELSRAYQNLKKHENRIDYIITHKYECTDEPVESIDHFAKVVDQSTHFRHWYCGHWHMEKQIDTRHSLIYETPIPLK